MITISGQNFVPYTPYLLYWAPPEEQIDGPVYADDIGQLTAITHTVPVSAAVGSYQIIARLQDGTTVAQAAFQVTGGQ